MQDHLPRRHPPALFPIKLLAGFTKGLIFLINAPVSRQKCTGVLALLLALVYHFNVGLTVCPSFHARGCSY